MAKGIFVGGYPGEVGGANTELWHTVKLWRRFGLEVTLIPAWGTVPLFVAGHHRQMVGHKNGTVPFGAPWRDPLEAIGCRTGPSNLDDLQSVPGLAGSVVVSIGNTRFVAAAARFRQLGCRVVWLGCMNWLLPEERLHYRRCGVFDRHVFQSRYERDELCPQLARYGYQSSQGRLIRGAFDVAEFPFRPRAHLPGEPFVVGRLSRAAPDKFSPRTWAIYGRVPPPRAARVMGWSAAVEARLGAPPRWAECLPAGAETPQDFLAQLHCCVIAAGGAVENWPRAGLEAMAAGVPLVVERRGGWPEMLRHGETGCLCENEDEMVSCTARLAVDPSYREQMIEEARRAVERLCDPERWWRQWKDLLEELQR
jgi:hypothetical protein